jgi:hypothetical protein
VLNRGADLLVVLVLAAVGCGPDGAPPEPGSGRRVIPSGYALNWLDDGVRHNATLGTAEFTHTMQMDILAIKSYESERLWLSLFILAPPPLSVGTLDCVDGAGYPYAKIDYGGQYLLVTKCSITLSTIVLTGTPRVSGKFEYVTSEPNGITPSETTRSATDGNYDLPLTISPPTVGP